jgi:hypothetical protein
VGTIHEFVGLVKAIRRYQDLVNNYEASFGIWAKVEVSGEVHDGDKVLLI